MSYNKATGMYEGYIYKIYNDVNDKLYIGQTITTLNERFANHICHSKNIKYHQHIYNAMRKYGIENFHIIELVKVQNELLENLHNELDEIEKLYIKFYNTFDESLSSNGYNEDEGGKSSTKHCRKICKYDLFGALLCCYDSLSEAARCMDCSRYAISKVCNGEKGSYNGFVWRYEEDNFYKYPINKVTGKDNPKNWSCLCIMVNCYTLNGIFVKTYNSIENARIDVGLKNGCHITNVCKGKRNYSGGYKWYYADDPNQPDKTKIIKAS